LSLAQSERLTRIVLLEIEAIEVFGSEEAALRWLDAPSIILSGESPLEMTDTSFGFDAVRRLLGSIRYGSAA